MCSLSALNRTIAVAGLVVLFAVAGNAAETTIASIIAEPAKFDGTTITVQGAAASVKETTSRAGNDYTTFQIQDAAGSAVRVFSWGHPDIIDGDRLEVTGVYQQVKRVGRYTFYNEIDAQSIKPSTR